MFPVTLPLQGGGGRLQFNLQELRDYKVVSILSGEVGVHYIFVCKFISLAVNQKKQIFEKKTFWRFKLSFGSSSFLLVYFEAFSWFLFILLYLSIQLSITCRLQSINQQSDSFSAEGSIFNIANLTRICDKSTNI